MIITNNPDLKQTIYNNIRTSIVKEREGVHLSDTIYCIRKAYFRKMGMAPEPTDELCVLWMTGYAFQQFMFPLDKEITFFIDGINCTPDIPTGIEVKSTRQSSKKFNLEDMPHWRRQILGYCKALNKLEYDLVVLFVTGNYAPPFPAVDCWHITTTVEEVEENWVEVLQRAVKLQLALQAHIPPEPNPMHWEWEYCECIELCQDTECWGRKQLGGKRK